MSNRVEKSDYRPGLPQIVEAMPDGLFALDTQCRICHWNQTMEKITGYPAAETMGKPCIFLECSTCAGQSRKQDPEPLECAFMHMEQDPGISRRECAIRARDGSEIPVLRSARVIRDTKGKVYGLVETVTDLRYRQTLHREIQTSDARSRGLPGLVGRSHAMEQVYELIRLAAQSDATVLINGDTGTGKERAADAIHQLSARKHGPFVKINCSALPEGLLESELFGHVKGAFTGATSDKIGRFEAADGGTILLDEIGDVSPLIQLKLLRVIQERVFERVGDSRERTTDVRVIAATHRNLREQVALGKIREDFYYRIKVFDIRMPSLMERKEDIPVLAKAFVDRFNSRTGKHIEGFSPDVNYIFMDYCWPGNVRELENAIEHAFVTCQGPIIEIKDLPLELRTVQMRMAECRRQGVSTTLASTSRTPPVQGGKEELMNVLQSCGWNKAEAARRLGTDRTTIWRRMKRWGIPLSG